MYADKRLNIPVIVNSMDSEMSWLFDARPRGMWCSSLEVNEDDNYVVVNDLKLDDFIRRK